MKHQLHIHPGWLLSAAIITTVLLLSMVAGQEPPSRGKTSYAPVVVEENFESMVSRMTMAKPAIVTRHRSLLEERYDLVRRRNTSGQIESDTAQKLSIGCWRSRRDPL